MVYCIEGCIITANVFGLGNGKKHSIDDSKWKIPNDWKGTRRMCTKKSRIIRVVCSIVVVLLFGMQTIAFAAEGDVSANAYGDPKCSSYCYGVKNANHKLAHNTKITGTGKTTALAKKNHNTKMKKHKAGMPDYSHDGQLF